MIMTIINVLCLLTVLAVLLALPATAQIPQAPAWPKPDDRFKADLLVVVAHPDDDIAITPYLARAVFDEHKRVAVVFGTVGDGGPSDAGTEQGRALADVRQIEGRRALATLGITNVWFLGGHDTPGQDVLHSLETWQHGASLETLVRLMRLTRPEVVLTLLPAYVAGENHDDHQAAAVLATEAFDLAGDPTAFAEQMAVPRKHNDNNKYGAALRLWQPKKLYFVDVAGQHDFMGHGPRYSEMEISPSKGVAYETFRQHALCQYKSQNGLTTQRCLDVQQNKTQVRSPEPVQMIFGKSLVQASCTGDLFEGIASVSLPYIRPRGAAAVTPRQTVSLELGGPWGFYRDFWPAHDLQEVASLVQPEASVGAGEELWVPLVIRNGTPVQKQVMLRSVLPTGWTATPADQIYTIDPYDIYPVQLFIAVPKTFKEAWEVSGRFSGLWQVLKWQTETAGTKTSTVQLNVFVL